MQRHTCTAFDEQSRIITYISGTIVAMLSQPLINYWTKGHDLMHPHGRVWWTQCYVLHDLGQEATE